MPERGIEGKTWIMGNDMMMIPAQEILLFPSFHVDQSIVFAYRKRKYTSGVPEKNILMLLGLALRMY